MYGFNQNGYGGYGSGYAGVSAYSGLGQSSGTGTQQPTLQNSVFGSGTNAAYGYGSSVPSVYGYSQSASLSASSAAAAAGAANAYAAQQAGRLAFDAYSAFTTPGFTTPANVSQTSLNYHRNPSALSAAQLSSQKAYGNLASNSLNNNKASSSYAPQGYDAAVLAAATSLLQSKAAGNSNSWMPKKGNGSGFVTRSGHRYNKNSQPRESQQFYCETCKISCAGQQTYKEHLEGQRHKKKEALAQGQNNQSLPKNKVSFRCDLCNVTCTGQDTYQAHVRGVKHQKTLSLCKKLGKPIPTGAPTIIPPSELGGRFPPPPPPPPPTGTPIPTVGTSAATRVVGIATIKFVPSSSNSTSMVGNFEQQKQSVIEAVSSVGKSNTDAETDEAVKAQTEELQALIAAEQSVKPVGEQFIDSEKDSSGKLIQYICKLCDCKFSDPNAKEIHLKGRRHRLQYKMKVDPSIEVELKTQMARRANPRMHFVPQQNVPRPPVVLPVPPPRYPLWLGPPPLPNPANRFKSSPFEASDEQYFKTRHSMIYPDSSFLELTSELICNLEKTLKKVSDYFHDRTISIENSSTTDVAIKGPEKDRLLKGVMRVGILAKQLMLKNDSEVQLVVLCTKIPTAELLKEISELMTTLYENAESKVGALSVEAKESEASVIVRAENCPVQCRILLTSRDYRDGGGTELPSTALNKDACLLALAHLRRIKWFQVKCNDLVSIHTVLRVFRHIRRTNAAWNSMTDWMMELLAEKCISRFLVPLPSHAAFIRVLEAIAGGVLFKFPNGPGLIDPCEKDNHDALAELTDADRDQITESAQYMLRQAFAGELYKVIDVPSSCAASSSPGDRKRPLTSTKESSDTDDAKKDKKDGEPGAP